MILVDGNSEGRHDRGRAPAPTRRSASLTQSGRGKGDAFRTGFAAVTGNLVVMLDADGSADPAEIPRFVEALEAGADFAKGSRFLPGGGSADITRLRSLGNTVLSGSANLLHGTHFTDLCYGYNAFWARCLPFISLDVPGFEVETLINLRIAGAGMKITEVPSYEQERISGQSNLNTFRDGFRVLGTILQRGAPPAQHPSRARAPSPQRQPGRSGHGRTRRHAAGRGRPPLPLASRREARSRRLSPPRSQPISRRARRRARRSASWRRSCSAAVSACCSARWPTRSPARPSRPSQLLLWAGVLLIAGPIFYRLTSREPPAERLALVCLLGLSLYAIKVVRDAPLFTFSDEILHAFNADRSRAHGPPLPPQPDPPGHPLLPRAGRSDDGADEADRALQLRRRGDRRRRRPADPDGEPLPALQADQRLGPQRRARCRDLRGQLQLPLLRRPVLLRVAGAAAAGRGDDGRGRARSWLAEPRQRPGPCRSRSAPCAIVITHHLTSYALAGILAALAVLYRLVRGTWRLGEPVALRRSSRPRSRRSGCCSSPARPSATSPRSSATLSSRSSTPSSAKNRAAASSRANARRAKRRRPGRAASPCCRSPCSGSGMLFGLRADLAPPPQEPVRGALRHRRRRLLRHPGTALQPRRPGRPGTGPASSSSSASPSSSLSRASRPGGRGSASALGACCSAAQSRSS